MCLDLEALTESGLLCWNILALHDFMHLIFALSLIFYLSLLIYFMNVCFRVLKYYVQRSCILVRNSFVCHETFPPYVYSHYDRMEYGFTYERSTRVSPTPC
ncbi:hypothetical protein BDN70DRAFT_610737 [Pholiota conissans]|uniref:Uncharacterized protein n=1 Tax=Pholiota conissans TaxID=109636 RepID=A0A9P6CSZ2_9AGAR|nr:hypothetical protein BDN70DRAFT_610737 [Pholiota conissans]